MEEISRLFSFIGFKHKYYWGYWWLCCTLLRHIHQTAWWKAHDGRPNENYAPEYAVPTSRPHHTRGIIHTYNYIVYDILHDILYDIVSIINSFTIYCPISGTIFLYILPDKSWFSQIKLINKEITSAKHGTPLYRKPPLDDPSERSVLSHLATLEWHMQFIKFGVWLVWKVQHSRTWTLSYRLHQEDCSLHKQQRGVSNNSAISCAWGSSTVFMEIEGQCVWLGGRDRARAWWWLGKYWEARWSTQVGRKEWFYLVWSRATLSTVAVYFSGHKNHQKLQVPPYNSTYLT